MSGLFEVDPADNAPITQFVRGLKGGSGGGGGGGGGGRGGGSYSSGGSRIGYGGYYGTNSSGSSGDSMPVWALILIVVIIIIIIVAICIHKGKSIAAGSPSPGSDSSFETAVGQARGKQTDQAIFNARLNNQNQTTAQDNAMRFETYEGDFDVKYMDRGNVLTSFVKIQLKNNGDNGYKIEGECSDADGSSKITEGRVLYSGEAWWVEETFSGADKGMKVLTEGKFDLSKNEFSGTWRANTGIRGKYTEFRGKNISKNFRPQSAGTTGMTSNPTPQTLEQMLEEDIPMVHAMVETPVVAAAPYVHAVPESASAVPTVAASAAVPSAPPADSTPNQRKYRLYIFYK